MIIVHNRASAIICESLSLAVLALSPAALAQKTHQYDGGAILIPAGAPTSTAGPSAPYPSTVTVSGLTAPIGEVKVRLNGFSHTFVVDLDVLLVGPGGQTCLLLNRVGGGGPGVSNVDYLFADDGALIPSSSIVGSGRYRPSQLPMGTGFPTPAPAPPYGTSLGGFSGKDANGTWSLYILDSDDEEFGEIDGWSLLITEASSVANTAPIAIPAVGVDGPGNPYPSTAIVDGLEGTVQSVSVMLMNLTHTFPSDARFLLVGPQGQSCLLASRCGSSRGVAGVNLVIDDNAANPLPVGTLVSGSFRPTACLGTATLNFNAPAPAAPYGATLSVFNGAAPNGVWRLYVEDASPGDVGSLGGGWALVINGQVCPADFNYSGMVSVQDIFDFLGAYFAGCP
ncbi:MAG: hypothetical protein IT438_14140 [Phycisphaerales bacterium]|nr:hypothetical protein [Phycisphaerales bacterium]